MFATGGYVRRRPLLSIRWMPHCRRLFIVYHLPHFPAKARLSVPDTFSTFGHLFHIKKARPLCFLASQEVLQELRSFRPVSLKIPLHPERQKMNVSLARL